MRNHTVLRRCGSHERQEYSDGYTLISGNLSSEGDIQVNEQVVFFIYENQIAGIKLISDCF